jgi:hypothetical protein
LDVADPLDEEVSTYDVDLLKKPANVRVEAHPSGPLLNVSKIRLRRGTILHDLGHEGSLPTLAQ